MLSRYYLVVHLAEEAEKDKLLEKSPYKEQFEALKLQLLSNARVNEENNAISHHARSDRFLLPAAH